MTYHEIFIMKKKQVRAFLIITTDGFPLEAPESRLLEGAPSLWVFDFSCIWVRFMTSLKSSTQLGWLLTCLFCPLCRAFCSIISIS